MIINLRKYIFILLTLIYGCTDDLVQQNGGNEFNDILYLKYSNQHLAGQTYSIRSDGANNKLINDTLGITSIPYAGKMTLASADSGFYYSRLFVSNIDGTNLISIPRNGYYPIYYTLSPGGDKALYTAYNNYLVVINCDGSGYSVIYDQNIATSTPKFSPDGNYVALLSESQNRDALYIIKTDGSDTTLLKDGITSQYDARLDWSPDGIQIVFENSHPQPSGICTINRDGTNYLRITEGMTPAWSPDGSKICFLKNVNGGYFDLFVMNSDGSNEINISNTPTEHEHYPAWSSDSKKILYGNQNNNIQFLKMFDYNSMTTTILADSASFGFWVR